jgi:hypothetical protein
MLEVTRQAIIAFAIFYKALTVTRFRVFCKDLKIWGQYIDLSQLSAHMIAAYQINISLPQTST